MTKRYGMIGIHGFRAPNGEVVRHGIAAVDSDVEPKVGDILVFPPIQGVCLSHIAKIVKGVLPSGYLVASGDVNSSYYQERVETGAKGVVLALMNSDSYKTVYIRE